MLTIESWCIRVVEGGFLVSRTQPNRKIMFKRLGIIGLHLLQYHSISVTNIYDKEYLASTWISSIWGSKSDWKSGGFHTYSKVYALRKEAYGRRIFYSHVLSILTVQCWPSLLWDWFIKTKHVTVLLNTRCHMSIWKMGGGKSCLKDWLKIYQTRLQQQRGRSPPCPWWPRDKGAGSTSWWSCERIEMWRLGLKGSHGLGIPSGFCSS